MRYEEFGAKLEGGEELYALLKALPEKAAKRIEQGAIRKAVEKVRAQARANIRSSKRPKHSDDPFPYTETGDLAFSFTQKVKKKFGHVYGDVRANAPHAWLVEYGHRQKRKDGSTIQVKGHPFMRPALDSQAQAIGQAILDDMKEAVKNWKKYSAEARALYGPWSQRKE